MSNNQTKLKVVQSGSQENNPNIEIGSLTPKQQLWQLLGDPSYSMKPKKWLGAYNQCLDVTYYYKTDSVYIAGKPMDYDVYMADMRTCVLTKHIKGLSKQALEDAVKVWMHEQKIIFLRQMRATLSYAKPAEDLIGKWVRATTGKQDSLDIAVIRHFIWQVRRKLFGLPVDHHMMPILYGKTGGGKSVAVQKLLSPVADLQFNLDLSVFSDQFKMRLFTRAFVMFFDEMARSERADVDKLKNIITSPTVDFRIMRSEKIETGVQNCTFIGCSNDPVHDKIFDPTSARRYWQLNCSDKLDWSAINSIDYLALWKSVDEHASCPVIPVLEKIRTVQDRDIRHKDLIEDWISTYCKVKVANPKTDPTSQTLYNEFADWCRWQKINSQPTANKFYRQFKVAIDRLGWKIKHSDTNRGTTWPFEVQPSPSTVAGMNKAALLDDMVTSTILSEEKTHEPTKTKRS